MGVNSVHSDPVNRYEAFGAVREYHNWNWDDDGAGYPNNQNKWFGSYFSNWNFDEYYRNLKAQGTFLVCKSDSPDWMNEGRPRLSAFLPDSVGWHVFFTDVNKASTIVIRNNIFSSAPANPLMKFRCPLTAMQQLTLDYNCYHQPNAGDGLVFYDGRLYGIGEFDQYRRASGFDQHSIIADLKLAEFVTAPDSRCRRAGYDGPRAELEGMPASQYVSRDMGAPII